MDEAQLLNLQNCFEDACDILTHQVKNIKGVNRQIKKMLSRALLKMKKDSEAFVQEEIDG